MPSLHEMQSYVEAQYSGGAYTDYVDASDIKRMTFAERAREISRLFPGGRLLDLGCACGYFVEAALDEGFDAYGLEWSRNAVAAAPSEVRPRLFVGDVNQLARQGQSQYDVVTAFDIVEHTLDPIRFLEELRSMTRSGSVIVITTPDIQHFLRYAMGKWWPMLQPLQHTVLFSRGSLRLALHQAGYRDVTFSQAKKVLTADYLGRVFSSLYPQFARVYGAASPAIPQPLLGRRVSVNIGEFTAYARCSA